MCIFDHYFIVYDGMEYHLGTYKRGNVLPAGTTENSNLVYRDYLCTDCSDRLGRELDASKYRDRTVFKFFPFVNCETLVCGFSVQSTFTLAVPCVLTLIYFGKIVYAILLFMTALVLMLWSSKYALGSAKIRKCEHLVG